MSTKGFDRISVCTFLSYFLTEISNMLFVVVVECGFSPLLRQFYWGYAIFLDFSSILTSLAQNLWQQDEIWHISNESIVQALHLYDMHHHAEAFWVVKIGCILAGARFFTLSTQFGAYAGVSSIWSVKIITRIFYEFSKNGTVLGGWMGFLPLFCPKIVIFGTFLTFWAPSAALEWRAATTKYVVWFVWVFWAFHLNTVLHPNHSLDEKSAITCQKWPKNFHFFTKIGQKINSMPKVTWRISSVY